MCIHEQMDDEIRKKGIKDHNIPCTVTIKSPRTLTGNCLVLFILFLYISMNETKLPDDMERSMKRTLFQCQC